MFIKKLLISLDMFNTKTQNKMNKKLGTLVAANLDLDLFFSISVTNYQISLMAYLSQEIETYLLNKGFYRYDDLHGEEDSMVEMTNGEIRIVLAEK